MTAGGGCKNWPSAQRAPANCVKYRQAEVSAASATPPM